MLYEPGIRIVKIDPQRNGTVKARLAIDGGCRPGVHALRLRTASGISNLKFFSVGTLPEIREIEPNNDCDKPQKIPLNVTVNGVVDYEDVDYFAVDLKKGQRITAEIEGIRLGETFFDPYVAILDARRIRLGVRRRYALLRRTPRPRQSFRPTAPTSSRCGRVLHRIRSLPLSPARGHVSASLGDLSGGRPTGRDARGSLAGRRCRSLVGEDRVAPCCPGRFRPLRA